MMYFSAQSAKLKRLLNKTKHYLKASFFINTGQVKHSQKTFIFSLKARFQAESVIIAAKDFPELLFS